MVKVKIKGSVTKILFEDDKVCSFGIKESNSENEMYCILEKSNDNEGIKRSFIDSGQVSNFTMELRGKRVVNKRGKEFINNNLYLQELKINE